MHCRSIPFVLLLCAPTTANAGPPAALEKGFTERVRPFLQTHCLGCHGREMPKGGFDLSGFTTVESAAKDHRAWELMRLQLQAGTMPPPKAKERPTAAAKQAVLDWAKAVRRYEADRTAGDPGVVPARRLSNAEYDHTVRDLTGVDIRPAKEFPVDPANEAGFDNSAESLTASPALVKKYLEAARKVADHLILTPDGFTFAGHPAVADTDRDKYAVRRIIDFYKRQRTDCADYFHAAWRYRHRAALGKPDTTLADVAAEAGVSAKYLATVWATLTEQSDPVGPIAAIQALWKELPTAEQPARAACERMRDFVGRVRQQLVPEVKNLTAPGVQNGSQTLVMWKNRQFVANRMRYAGGALALTDVGLPPDSPAAKAMAVPADKKAYEATFHRFCRTFPDTFYVSERARVYLDQEKEKEKGRGGRLLSAGFHSMTGYFRDDGPLCELMLDDSGRRELDRLWREFDFVTGAPIRQHTSFIWFERTDSSFMRDPEFDPFRAEDKDSTSADKIQKLAVVYADKAKRRGASDTALEAIRVHFETVNAAIRAVEKDRAEAEPKHRTALLTFAQRAYRRPLTGTERHDLVAFYQQLRDRDGLTHEEAVRDSVVCVLMSPHFCYHVGSTAGRGTQPLSDTALASRLSYFLWASMPDDELLKLAAAGELQKPDVLAAQARRMLRAPQARGLATEFAGHWLDFRRFEQHNGVDRGRFPAFDDDLRRAMFEEPVRFVLDVAREDRSVLDFLDSNRTFVNPTLARHYGMPIPKSGDWEPVDASPFGRGGLLPMAVFLTQNSPGLRTSPVKRGYWVVRRLLGEVIPAPPSEVPELPADEAKLGDRTLRETLARHREHQSCAGCHNRFDSVGLVFEGFGPVGEWRDRDLGGRPVDTRATFPDGTAGTGVDGLRTYLRSRQPEFVDNLCRKLLAYALGRSLQPGDDGTVETMKAKLAANGHRFGTLIDVIVTSPQFRTRRAGGEPTTGR